jgi:hypothetical protein
MAKSLYIDERNPERKASRLIAGIKKEARLAPG